MNGSDEGAGQQAGQDDKANDGATGGATGGTTGGIDLNKGRTQTDAELEAELAERQRQRTEANRLAAKPVGEGLGPKPSDESFAKMFKPAENAMLTGLNDRLEIPESPIGGEAFEEYLLAREHRMMLWMREVLRSHGIVATE